MRAVQKRGVNNGMVGVNEGHVQTYVADCAKIPILGES